LAFEKLIAIEIAIDRLKARTPHYSFSSCLVHRCLLSAHRMSNTFSFCKWKRQPTQML